MRIARLLVALVLVASAFAADINGTWKSTIEFNGESINVSYDFKVEGGKLTGNVTGPRGEYPITEGKVEGDEFSFAISTGDVDVAYKGKIAADHLNITVRFGDNTLETTAKRP